MSESGDVSHFAVLQVKVNLSRLDFSIFNIVGGIDFQLHRVVRKLVFGAVQPQKMARGLKVQIFTQQREYRCSENKVLHYANTPMQYTAIIHGCKNVHFQMNLFLYFSYFCSKR